MPDTTEQKIAQIKAAAQRAMWDTDDLGRVLRAEIDGLWAAIEVLAAAVHP